MANLNPAWAEEAVRLFESGKNVTETAALVGASISTVGKVLRGKGCDTRRSRAGKQWRTPRVACPICGKPFLPCLTRKTCSVSCRKQRGHAGKYDAEMRSKIVSLRQRENLSLRSISEETGAGRETVRQVLKRAGVDTSVPGVSRG